MEIIRVLHAVPKMNREGIQSFLMNVYRNVDREKIQFDFLIHSKEKGAFEDEILSLGGHLFHLNKFLYNNAFFSTIIHTAKSNLKKQNCSYVS